MSRNEPFLGTSLVTLDECPISHDALIGWILELTDLTPTQVQTVAYEISQQHNLR